MTLWPDKDLNFACGSSFPPVSYHEVVKGGSCEWNGNF